MKTTQTQIAQQKYYLKHRDQRQVSHQKYYRTHREEIRENAKQYYLKHLEVIKARARETYRRNPEVHKELSRKNLWEIRRKVINLFGGGCIICGITDLRILTLNHKNGCGTKKRTGNMKVYRELLSGQRNKDDYDVRCFNCNMLYDYERGIRKVPKS